MHLIACLAAAIPVVATRETMCCGQMRFNFHSPHDIWSALWEFWDSIFITSLTYPVNHLHPDVNKYQEM